MKIAIPLLGFGRAGGQRVLSRLASELSILGHDVYIFVPGDGVEPYYPTSATIINTVKKKSRSKIFNLLHNYFKLWLAIKDKDVDVVIANHHLTAYIVALLPNKVQKYYYVQAYEVVFGYNIISKMLAYFTYLLPLKKIVNSETILPPPINKFIGVVPAGIDMDIFYPRDNVSCDIKTIGLVGRKEPHKGTRDIIQVLCRWGQNKNIIVNIAVYLSNSDKALLDRHGIEYHFYEISNDTQLANFYRLNELVIATGLVEDGAFHYPCAEAMACGCLVISNYAPLTSSSSHYKLATFDPTILEQKLNKYIDATRFDIDAELKDNHKIISNYSWEIVSKKFNSYLHKI
ncbi:glycosyltransferase [Lelliottia wanjuensis]|uniref:glycosyltransferase n=1 Tax=Lelliottia wanjuensis TaxID=3050585 RepID=UPI00255068AD|nr:MULTISPECIES: glycosyltransferase [unclassified Lelliottia]MDK9356979.1 glycosyltransferase [Lelliottia sp. V106_16]MDK9372349.1 glycosyltransferase [Lelliottia sp. V106_10]MDK9585686.1 glycosyltransferase [Lelliottia sp. V86_10]MDK9599153.1 glycosyltransferase [Lelliottia sp. V106_5]